MKKLKEITLEISTNTSKEKVWDLLFNRFSEVNVFNPLIEGSHHTTGTIGKVGCERHCDLDAKNAIKEKIVAARANDSFDLDIIEGGLPMMDVMKGTYNLQELNTNQTKVSFIMKFTTKPAFMAPMMKGMMANMLFKTLVGMKYHLETGNLVTKDNIKNIMKEYKQLNSNEAFTKKQKMVYA